jgi:flagellin-specific chaperone FliS
MLIFKHLRRSALRPSLLGLAAVTALVAIPAQAQNYDTTIIEEGEVPEPLELTEPTSLRLLEQSDSLLSYSGGQRLMNEAQNALDAQNYALAIDKLQQARQVFNQLSNFYAQLSDSFSGIDNRISDRQRSFAQQTAEMRDEATYRLALVHKAQNQPELAIPLLIQILRSQTPTTELGQRAYGQLPLGQPNSLISIEGGQRLMNEAQSAISEQNYALASEKLQQARQVYNQLSNFYAQLADSFSGIDGARSEEQRNIALQSTEMRDNSTYQLALVHRAQNQPELAVPLLIQIVRSQNPTTELGKKAYQQLFELGFVDSPYPRSRTSS